MLTNLALAWCFLICQYTRRLFLIFPDCCVILVDYKVILWCNSSMLRHMHTFPNPSVKTVYRLLLIASVIKLDACEHFICLHIQKTLKCADNTAWILTHYAVALFLTVVISFFWFNDWNVSFLVSWKLNSVV